MAVTINVTSLLAVFTLTTSRSSKRVSVVLDYEFVFVQILLCVCCRVLMIYSAETLA